MDHVFVTSTGRSIALRPVSQILIQEIIAGIRATMIERGAILDPPTYTVETAGGSEEFPHDETSIQDENTTDEDRAAWAQYLADSAEYDRIMKDKCASAILRRGILEHPENDDWVAEQEYDGANVPTEPYERRMHWIYTELFATPLDLARCIAQITRISAEGMPEDRIRAIEDTFQRALGGAERADDPGPAADTPAAGEA